MKVHRSIFKRGGFPQKRDGVYSSAWGERKKTWDPGEDAKRNLVKIRELGLLKRKIKKLSNQPSEVKPVGMQKKGLGGSSMPAANKLQTGRPQKRSWGGSHKIARAKGGAKKQCFENWKKGKATKSPCQHPQKNEPSPYGKKKKRNNGERSPSRERDLQKPRKGREPKGGVSGKRGVKSRGRLKRKAK